jgi:hypothetical protein
VTPPPDGPEGQVGRTGTGTITAARQEGARPAGHRTSPKSDQAEGWSAAEWDGDAPALWGHARGVPERLSSLPRCRHPRGFDCRISARLHRPHSGERRAPGPRPETAALQPAGTRERACPQPIVPPSPLQTSIQSATAACRLACTRVAGMRATRAGMKGARQAGRPELQAHRATPACECSALRGILARLPDRSGARTVLDAIRAAAISPFEDAPGISLKLHRLLHLDGGGARGARGPGGLAGCHDGRSRCLRGRTRRLLGEAGRRDAQRPGASRARMPRVPGSAVEPTTDTPCWQAGPTRYGAACPSAAAAAASHAPPSAHPSDP